MRAVLTVLMFVCGTMANAVFVTAQDQDPRRPPNIVFILADDLGWTDLGCQGSKYYETPNIDRLAAQGTRLMRYYHSQNCTPTRAALMTGQYAPRTGVYTVGSLERGRPEDRKVQVPQNRTELPPNRATVADVLRSAGYRTAIFGKWHLGQRDQHPSRRGFEKAIVSAGQHYNFKTQPEVEYPKGIYLADWLTDQSLDFMSRNRERPFFLYLAHFGVHSPHVAKAELIERFKDKQPVGGHGNPTYAAMIASIDESVGRVMSKLDELGLAENTLVIFASDNGGVGGYQREGLPRTAGVTDNAPLRGGKGMLYEGGLRVPFIARWPGMIPQGKTNDSPAAHVDLLPTLAEVAGARLPEQKLDGVSLLPILTGSSEKLAREAIYWHFPGYLEGGRGGWRTKPVGAMHAGDWKLLEFFEDGRLELYNLREDIGEKQNLAQKMPDKAKELHAKLASWRKKVGARVPERVLAAAAK